MNYHEGRRVDLYLNDRGSGTFIHQEQQVFEGATNGSVMFGDLNNDGGSILNFPDIVTGRLPELKPISTSVTAHLQTRLRQIFTALFRDNPRWQILTVTGTLDIISTGNGDNWVCLASLFYNTD